MSVTEEAVRERPILFSGPMVRAILDGRKTQTRSVVTGRDALEWLAPNMFTPAYVADRENGLSPYGYAGDLLWVRETFFDHGNFPGGLAATREERIEYRVDEWDRKDGDDAGPWTPSIHMPRWASRLTLRVTEVRVERVQDISEADAYAEGVGERWLDAVVDPRSEYRALWDELNAKRGYGWDANPWVWVISFERVATQPGGAA